jgi:hypothetical protein
MIIRRFAIVLLLITAGEISACTAPTADLPIPTSADKPSGTGKFPT